MSLSTQKKHKPVDLKELLPKFKEAHLPRPLWQPGTYDRVQAIKKRERLLDTDATIKFILNENEEMHKEIERLKLKIEEMKRKQVPEEAESSGIIP